MRFVSGDFIQQVKLSPGSGLARRRDDDGREPRKHHFRTELVTAGAVEPQRAYARSRDPTGQDGAELSGVPRQRAHPQAALGLLGYEPIGLLFSRCE